MPHHQIPMSPMNIRLYNTLTRRVEAFAPLDPSRLTMYVCGPTVYGYIHIGNARTFLVFDLLARTLKRHFPQVVYTRNITDIDDKINAAAHEQGVPISAITGLFGPAFDEDMVTLGLTPPDVVPHATAHIPQIIAMIEQLIASDHAYAAEGHVLFSVASFPAYGKLSRRDPDDMLAGARIDIAPYKRDAGDFVLWKPSTDDLPGWDSPWSRGRPGWHIECSAMAEAHLGTTIDIHGGGMDLQFPHHENEIAQSECAHGGKIFARYWLHSGMLNLDGSKMSKSVGNVFQLRALLAELPPEALRYALLSAHYRAPLDWSDALIEQSIRTLDRLYGTLRDLSDVAVNAEPAIPESIEAALCDDLNTPLVLAELAGMAAAARKAVDPADRAQLKSALLGTGRALGLLQQDPAAWFARGADAGDDVRIQALVDERNAAKAARDFARADAIRTQLADEGVLLEDTAQGVRWKRA
jgi:cysteinyl-tRNA synthetase